VDRCLQTSYLSSISIPSTVQATSYTNSSSFEPVLSNHCLAALDLGAGVEKPFDCLIVQNSQAMQSMRRSMDWTLEDNMVDSCSSAPHSQGAEEVILHLYRQERKRSALVWRRLSRTQALLWRAILGGGCRSVAYCDHFGRAFTRFATSPEL